MFAVQYPVILFIDCFAVVFFSSGYLYAHISYLEDNCPACLLLLSTDRNAFFELAETRLKTLEVSTLWIYMFYMFTFTWQGLMNVGKRVNKGGGRGGEGRGEIVLEKADEKGTSAVRDYINLI